MAAARRAVAVGAILLLVGCGGRDHGGADAVAVKTGERFTVTLAANASTGFTWRLARPLDERVVRLVEVAYRAPDAKLAGAGGAELWTFEAAGAGAATIELEYVRPWEHDVPALQTRTIAVSVTAPASSLRPRPGEPLALAFPRSYSRSSHTCGRSHAGRIPQPVARAIIEFASATRALCWSTRVRYSPRSSS